MGVRREERITMSEGSLRRISCSPLRIGPDMARIVGGGRDEAMWKSVPVVRYGG